MRRHHAHRLPHITGNCQLPDLSTSNRHRNSGYDSNNTADAFLNQPHVKAAMNAPDVFWVSCSEEVRTARVRVCVCSPSFTMLGVPVWARAHGRVLVQYALKGPCGSAV